MNKIQKIRRYWQYNEPNWVVVILIINLAYFALSLLITDSADVREGEFGPSGESLYLLGSSETHLILAGQWHRILTATFLHGGIFHILMNSYFLWQLGPYTQKILGAHRFLSLYLLAGIGGSLLSIGWKYYSHQGQFMWSVPGSVGASTSLFGILGFLLYWSRKTPGAEHINRQLVFCLMINVAIGFSSSNIDNGGHMGGLFTGLLFAQAWHQSRPNMLRRLMLQDGTTWVLVLTTVVCFLAVAAFYFGEFGKTCRILYRARPNLMLVYDNLNDLDSGLLREAAQEVHDLDEESGEDCAVPLVGLEAKLRQLAKRKSRKPGWFIDAEVLGAEQKFAVFLRGYKDYLGYTSRLQPIR